MNRAILVGIAVTALLSGCRGSFGTLCEDTGRYAGGAELPPVRVPDDLSVPNEEQALRIPQVARSSPPSQQGPGRGGCLESPPNYLEATGTDDGSPASSGDDADNAAPARP